MTDCVAGRLVVIMIATYNQIAAAGDFSTSVNVALPVNSITSAGTTHGVAMFWTTVTANGNCTVTWVGTSGNHHPSVAIAEYSGADTSSPVEDSSSNTGNSTSQSTGNIDASDNSMLAGVVGTHWTYAFTKDADYTQIYNQTNGNYMLHNSVDRSVSAGTYNIPWTSGTEEPWFAVGAAIKKATVGSVKIR
jgi:hypothetical protein